MMIDEEILRSLLDHKKLAILKVLCLAKEEMYLRELAKKSGVPVSTVFRAVGELTKLGLVRVKEIKMMKFYSLVRDGRSLFLEEWFREEGKLWELVAKLKEVGGLKKILLQGKAEENRANLILVGEKVEEKKAEEICMEAKNKGLDASCVVLTQEQLEKLEKMGVYAGEKKVLWG